MKTTREILVPEYYKKFHCNGLICEDNCCEGRWNIYVDEKHYKKIKNVQDKELKDKIQKYIRRNRSNPSKEGYGKIHQDEKLEKCIFLTEDKLCEIQLKLGTEYLCNVCMNYPRYSNSIDGKLEKSCTVACPILAETALLKSEPMAFEYIEESIETRTIVHNFLNTKEQFNSNRLEKYFWDIRIFSISLLQNRDYNLSERLIILGIVYKKVEKLHESNVIKDIPIMLENMSTIIKSGTLKEEIKKIPINNQIQMRLAKEMTDERLIKGITSKRYMECLKEALLGIDYISGEKLDNIIKKYNKNYNKFVEPYLNEKEYIFENFLVNEYFRQLMPFGSFKSIWDSYVFLCVMYSLVKLHMIGMAGYHNGLNDKLVIKLIQSFSKVVIHTPQYIEHIIELIKENNYDTLAYMTILIKN